MSAWKSRDTRKQIQECQHGNQDGIENRVPTMRPYHYGLDI